MGSIPATTYIKHIRWNVSEPVSDAELVLPGAGSTWTNEEILENLNKAKDDAWDLIRATRESYFQVLGATISLNSTTKEYSLAADFWQNTGLKITTSGYEGVRLRLRDMDTKEFQDRDAVPQGYTADNDELLYCIVEVGGTFKIKFADYPPTNLTLSYDYIKILPDFTLSGSSMIDISDTVRRFIEASATEMLLLRDAGDKRLPAWTRRRERMEAKVIQSVSKKEIRESTYVEEYDPS